MKFTIPQPLKSEHETLHERLRQATEAGGEVGEVVKRVSPECKLLAPNVPWKQIAGMRDRLVHDYFDIVPEQVWNAAFSDIPRLRWEIEALMQRLEP